ncbi:MAG: EAL domain-containing protein, partial [Polyangiaceae bacterium]
LVTEMHDNEAKRALVQMLGELAGRLDAWVLAEGIETEPELNALLQLEVPLGQGYFLAKPEPPWARLGDEPIAALARISRHRRAPTAPKRPSAPPPQPIAGEAMEPVATCHGADGWPAASAKIAVRVDDGGKPIEMRLTTEDGARLRAAHDLMRIKASAPISVVVNRALTRPERLRWDPLVCVDDDGKLEGVIPMQRLVAMLSRIVQGSEPQSGMRQT